MVKYTKEGLNNLLWKFNELDMDDLITVETLVLYFRAWLRWNKTYEDIEVLECENFRTIVIVHNLCDELSIYDSWKFVEDVIYWLEEYVTHDSDEEFLNLYYNDVYEFWNNKLNGLLK